MSVQSQSIKIILLLLLIVLNLSLTAQDFCYEEYKTKGIQAYDALNFENALNQFAAAKICDDVDLPEITGWIDKTQNGYIIAIKSARDSALYLKQQAEEALRLAEKAQKESESLRLFVSGQERELRGFPREAIDYYSQAIAIRPGDLSFRERRVQLTILDTINYRGMAIADLEYLSKFGNPQKRPYYLNDLALQLAKAKNFMRAVDVQSEALRMVRPEDKKLFKDRLDAYKNRTLYENDNSVIAKNVQFNLIPQGMMIGAKGDVILTIGEKRIKLPVNSGRTIKLNGLRPGSYDWSASGRINGPVDIFKKQKFSPVKGKGTIVIQPYTRYNVFLIERNFNSFEVRISRY